MRALALDLGEVRCGIAISDANMSVASPLCVLPSKEVETNAASFRRVLEDWQPDCLVVGLPLSMSGEEGPQAQRIRRKAKLISAACNLPLHFADERLSSIEAKRSLHEAGYNERTMRGKVDMIAAGLFLQAWLDAGKQM